MDFVRGYAGAGTIYVFEFAGGLFLSEFESLFALGVVVDGTFGEGCTDVRGGEKDGGEVCALGAELGNTVAQGDDISVEVFGGVHVEDELHEDAGDEYVVVSELYVDDGTRGHTHTYPSWE